MRHASVLAVVFLVLSSILPPAVAAVTGSEAGVGADPGIQTDESAQAESGGDAAPAARADQGEPADDAVPGEEDPVPVPEPSDEALRYHRSGNVLWVVNTLWGLAIPALFLFTGFSARIRDWAKRIGRRWFFVIVAYLVIYSILVYLLSLPLSYYQGFFRPHAYGLSNQTFAKWMTDSLKGLMVGLVGGALFLWLPYLLLEKARRRWWLYTAMAVVPFLFFVMLVTPIWIQPLFNDFGPMQDQELERSILQLADRAGIEGGRVFEVDKSVDTNTVNAYVAGFLDTKRIVLWDTIIAELDEEELLFVMGHEMGHYVLNHVVTSILFFSVLIGVALYGIHRTAGYLIDRFRERFGFTELSDVASLPLLILLFNLFFLVLGPVALGWSRHNEHEADRFALELTRDNRAGATAFVELQQENLGHPRPGLLYKLWRSSHPPLGERIEFCNEYRPWEEGEPLRYDHLFEPTAGSTE